jgi:spore coat protein U-like protein
MKRVLFPAMIAGSFLTAGAAEAVSPATTTMPVTLTISASCTVSAATLDFGNNSIIDIASPIDASANLTVTCTNDAPYNIALDAGLHDGSSGINSRKLQIGVTSDQISYQLYRDSNHTQVWGFTTSGTPDVLSSTGTGDAQTIPVYGRVAGSQTNPKIGTYTDTITVNVNY